MQLEIITFGKITDFIQSGKIIVPDMADTGLLKKYLECAYPQLTKIKYKLAINKVSIQENIPLTDGATIAIMPPFSGG